ncbi:uncharacterized protein LOC129754101 [Uranotaenia lowii]|uniref:uncharacterized protein LOC129752337 n=1 Tax=Uranotaenia lowii TaxID=190385 RepID=UPI00247A0BB5|nr:uncharacterized protein LOC129752337 [Uranotaenia lowii]XP_055605943.1 uncharacterized protein LOC129754101 [Uranotaenia lowii]
MDEMVEARIPGTRTDSSETFRFAKILSDFRAPEVAHFWDMYARMDASDSDGPKPVLPPSEQVETRFELRYLTPEIISSRDILWYRQRPQQPLLLLPCTSDRCATENQFML